MPFSTLGFLWTDSHSFPSPPAKSPCIPRFETLLLLGQRAFEEGNYLEDLPLKVPGGKEDLAKPDPWNFLCSWRFNQGHQLRQILRMNVDFSEETENNRMHN